MILKVLDSWEYKPTFAGNDDMVIVFRRLSGAEEMAIRREATDDLPELLFAASVKEIKNPFTLEMQDGKRRTLKVSDIYTIGALKDLYYELVIEYSKRTVWSEETSKKPELPFT